MRTLRMLLAVLPLLAGCARQSVSESLAGAAVVEGRSFAAEMAAQSPFQPVEMRWSEAGKAMEERNRVFLDAQRRYQAAASQRPEVSEITAQVRRAVASSLGGALSPGVLIEALRNPAVQVPKQLASLGGIKDVPHRVAKVAWQDASESVDAELVMREQRVKLQQLLREGELIERELALMRQSPSGDGAGDAVDAKPFNAWKAELAGHRSAWLRQVRDMFDAEYQDVRFIRDGSGLPTYEDVEQPDLADWRRWCRLAREKELIERLAEAHARKRTAIPGAIFVGNRLGQMVRADERPESRSVRDEDAVRREVRHLVQNWRRMKQAQQEAIRLEAREENAVLRDAADVKLRQRIYQLRSAEIEHVGVIWGMDEACWE